MKKYFLLIFLLSVVTTVLYSKNIVYLSSLNSDKEGIFQDILLTSPPLFKVKKIGRLSLTISSSIGSYDNQNVFIAGYSDIYLFNINNPEPSKFNKLTFQSVFKDIGKVIFISNENKKTYLYSGDVDRGFLQDKAIRNIRKIAGVTPVNNYFPVYRISKQEIFFLYRSDDYTFIKYNLFTGKIEFIKIDNCYPALWRDKTNELVCINQDKKSKNNYFYAQANGKIDSYFKLRGDLFLYMPDSDEAVMNIPEYFSDGVYSAIYNFSTGEVKKIPDGVNLYPGSSIYLNQGVD